MRQPRDWHRVVFIGEGRYCLFDGRRRVYRRRIERTAACCVQGVVLFGGGGVMAWEQICGRGHLWLLLTET